MLLSCGVFILGCNKPSDEVNEVAFEEEVVSEDIGGTEENNAEVSDQQNQGDSNVVDEAIRVGTEQRESGNFKAAIETYTKAIEQDSNNAGLYADRGRAKRDSGDLDGAIEDETKALELSQEAWLYAERAVSYQVKGEKDLALQDYKKALSINPDIDWIKQSIKDLENN